VRTPGILLGLGFVAAASAQVTSVSVPEGLIQNAFMQQSMQQPIDIYLAVAQTTAGVKVNYVYDMTYSSSIVNNRLVLQVNIIGYIGNSPAVRIVGDGVTLWRYDYEHNTYSAVNYGTYSGAQPADYNARFFRYLGSITDAYSAYSVKFLEQVYTPSGAAYFSWAPGTTPVQSVSGPIVYSVGNPQSPRRTITFTLTGTPNVIGSIDYHDVAGTYRTPVVTDWTLTPTTLTQVDTSFFKFAPPANAKAVAGPKLNW
jgi:hypothetical protein